MQSHHRLSCLGVGHALEVLGGETSSQSILEHICKYRVVPGEPAWNRLMLVVGPVASMSYGRPNIERSRFAGELIRRSRLDAMRTIRSAQEAHGLEASVGIHLDKSRAEQ